MKNIFINSAVLLSAFIMFTGCGSPKPAKFNPNQGVMIFLKGNPYLVPVGSKSGYINELAATTFHNTLNIFHNCKSGDAWWAEPAAHSRIFPPSRNINAQEIKYAIENGLYKCTTKMSDKEYQYYVQNERQNKQMAHDSNIRSQNSFDNTLNQLNYNNQEQMNRNTYNYNQMMNRSNVYQIKPVY